MSSRFFCHNNTIAAAAAANNVYAWYPTMQLIDDGSTEDGVLASKASVSEFYGHNLSRTMKLFSYSIRPVSIEILWTHILRVRTR